MRPKKNLIKSSGIVFTIDMFVDISFCLYTLITGPLRAHTCVIQQSMNRKTEGDKKVDYRRRQ
jgi:hypothetical protein